MRRTISSAQTFFLKVVLPPLWIGGFAVVTALFFARAPGFRESHGSPTPVWIKWVFLVITIAGSALLYWTCVRLKRVELDRNALYVSNFLKEVAIPLRDIEEITENLWVNTHPVTVRFRRDTGFGTSIVFAPTLRLFAFRSPHPVVAELRAAVRRARGEADEAGT